MYNEELFQKLEAEFGSSKMLIFSEMMARKHDLLYIDHINEGFEEFTEEDFERDWWLNKHKELSKILKFDPVIMSVVNKIENRSAVGIKKYNTTLEENNTDDFLKHLQEELMDAVNYVQKLMNILKTKGYDKLQQVPNRNDFNDTVNDFSDFDLERNDKND